MDWWDTYIASIREHARKRMARSSSTSSIWPPQHLEDAVERLRRMEDKTPKAAGDDRLAGTCYDWLAKSGRDGTEGPQGIRRTENQ